MRFAREGWPFMGVALVVLLTLIGSAVLAGGMVYWLLAIVWLPVALWVAWFFRDPGRQGPCKEAVITAPADGKVIAVTEQAEAEFIGGPATRISIFMNVFDVHVNRYPVDGTIEYRQYTPGKFFNASLDKASSDNERMALGIATPRGRVLVKQIAGLIARRIVAYPQVGDAARQGERLGMIRFGSRVDTLLPTSAEPRVAVGDRTQAGITIIAEWAS